MTTAEAILKCAQQGLVTFPTGTPPSVSTIKKRYYYLRKGANRPTPFSERPTPKSGIASPQDKAIRDGAGFTYEPPGPIPYRPPGGTYGTPLKP